MEEKYTKEYPVQRRLQVCVRELPRYIRLLLAAFFAIVPMDYVLPHIGNYTMLTPVGMVIALFCLVDIVCLKGARFSVEYEDVVIVWLAFLNILSITWAQSYSSAVSHTMSFAMTGALYFLLMAYDYSEKDIRMVEISAMIGGAVLVLYVFTQVDFTLILGGYRLDFDNLGSGNFSDPNGLAGRLMMSLFFGIKFSLAKKTKAVLRICCIGLSGLIILVIFLTGSRSGFLALSVGLVFVVTSFVREKRVGLLMCSVLGLAVAALYLPNWLPEHIYARIFSYEKYAEVVTLEGDRIDIWTHLLLDIFPQAPLVGHGAGNAALAMYQIYGRLKAIHNSHLLFLAELGVLGFVPWMVFVIAKVKKALAVRKENPICIAVFVAILIVSFVLDASREKYLWNMFLYAYMNYRAYEKTKEFTGSKDVFV